MCEVIAGAGGRIAVDVDGRAATSGPVALQAVQLVLPEGTLYCISFCIYGLQGIKRECWILVFKSLK